MIKDYYKVMGLGRAATAEEIKQAYRKLAMEVHPDRNVDKPECEERLKEINEAYSVLGNKGKRRRYDVLCQQSLRAGLRSGEDPDSDLVNVLYAFFAFPYYMCMPFALCPAKG